MEIISPIAEINLLVLQSLTLLSRRENWKYIEFWLKTDDSFLLSDIHFAGKGEFEKLIATYRSSAKTPPDFIQKIFLSQKPVDLSQAPSHAELGFVASCGIPVNQSEATVGVLLCFGDALPANLENFSLFCNSLIASGSSSSQKKIGFYPHIDGVDQQKTAEQMAIIFNTLVSQRIFNRIHIYDEVDWWFNMNIPTEYYDSFNNDQIAHHIHCFMAAKKLGQAMNHVEFVYVDNVTLNTEGVPVKKFLLCPATFVDSVQVENKIEEFFHNKPADYGIVLKYLISGGTSYPNGSRRLSIYIAEVSPFLQRSDVEVSNQCDINKISTESFIANTCDATQKKYQEFLSRASLKLRPIYTIEPCTKDNMTPVRLIVRHTDKSSFLQRCTEVLRLTKIPCRSKSIESFSNGAVVYTFHLETIDLDKVNDFVSHVQLISMVGGHALRNFFLDGTFAVEEFAYIFAVKKFIYYFSQPNEDFRKLAESLISQDSANYQRLIVLQNKLYRKAISKSRILECLSENIGICKQLFADFIQCAKEKPLFNHALKNHIQKMVGGDDIDVHILTSFLKFNSSILKTNFWGKSKAALSFSLDPKAFMKSSGFEHSPYCIFYVVGAEFQGFHIRVRDISRGGIRVIKSANHSAYEKNLDGQFLENYDLAYTQHMKNKDIPEFGSKGTVLLNEDYQESTKISFQKYISGLMDLLVIEPNDNIYDHYNKEEILFLGPDENTADLMEWAALYAKRRRYPYWKAFTTGKPAYLGGIPHDVYGMTTRGVHEYVLGCLEKLGLAEDQVTKVQTGGPDGDLGSNEILLSKDKTIAIIDGSGVLYDKDGIHRETLVDLAKRRVMIDQFDVRFLSSHGFRVLVSDTNVTLPTGEVVESGLHFRNSFHLHSLFTADLFVPCGGRPQSIHINNVNQLFDTNNNPKFKIIVEGANLFFTQDARLELEKAGVVLYKDSSANKGGVTSSSLEVLAALSLTDEEHGVHMQVKETVPHFYDEYVKDIQATIQLNAQLEFNCIWDEHVRTKLPRSLLSDKISQKINDLNDACLKSRLIENQALKKQVMRLCLPRSLLNLVTLDVILQRLPSNYCSAIFNAYIASHYVYKYGLHTNEFGLFEFIESLLKSS